MSGFNKLVPEICESSIWNQPSDIRIVWITLLAKKDWDGYVRGDAQTIARMANVPLAACKEALRLFQEPDLSSHTPDNDGRRVALVPGGWQILNNDIYREIGMKEAAKAYWREQKRLQRHAEIPLSKTVPGHVRVSSVSVSVSGSAPEGSEEGGKSDKPSPNKGGNSNTIGALALEAERCFAPDTHHASAGVLANIHELLQAGHQPDRLRLVFDWVKKGGKYKPQHAMSMTDPGKFGGFAKQAMNPNGNEDGGRRRKLRDVV